MIEEGILTACSNHLAVLLYLVMSANFSEETGRNLLEQCVSKWLSWVSSSIPKKNREAVPNVVIVKPCIDDEHPTNKRSTSKECYCSAAILSRAESEVKSLYIKAIALFSYIKFELSDTYCNFLNSI